MTVGASDPEHRTTTKTRPKSSEFKRFATGGMPPDQIRKMLGRAPRLAAALSGSPRDRAKLIRGLVEKVIVAEEAIIIKMRSGALLGRDVPSPASADPSSSAIELTVAIVFKQRAVVCLIQCRQYQLGFDTALLKDDCYRQLNSTAARVLRCW